MARKRKPRKRRVKAKTIKIRLKPRRLHLIIGKLGFKRKEIEKRAEKARFGKLGLIRNIITPEKMRLLREIKAKNPSSIYELAKSVKRDIKSVRNDIVRLEEIGFVKLKHFKKTRRTKIQKVKPTLKIGRLNIVIEFA